MKHLKQHFHVSFNVIVNGNNNNDFNNNNDDKLFI